VSIVIDNLINSTEITGLDRVVAFTEARHQVLANNIANIDTPGYKMKDLNVEKFQSDLHAAMEARSAGQAEGEALQTSTDYDQYLLFHDQNNRSIDKQVTTITQNAVMHNAAIELLRSRYQLLQRAISGKL
jgi:flagellar basal-body rod protein FlgB